MSDLVPSLIRTYTPVVVAAAVGWLAQIGVVLPADASAALGTVVGGLAGALYYLAIRLLEQRWPALGRLLGSAKPPTYAPMTADGAHVVTTLPALGPVGISADGLPLYTEDRIRLDDIVHLALDAEHQAGRLPDDVDKLALAARITDAIATEVPDTGPAA